MRSSDSVFENGISIKGRATVNNSNLNKVLVLFCIVLAAVIVIQIYQIQELNDLYRDVGDIGNIFMRRFDDLTSLLRE